MGNAPYYASKEGDLYVIRQARFRGFVVGGGDYMGGSEHPHDVMAVGRSVEEIKSMADAYLIGNVDYSEVDQ